MDVSVVTTLCRTEEFLEEFYRRMKAEAERLSSRYEIVLVNDGSRDVALELHCRDARVKVIDLSRNFGHHKALMTGLAHSRGRLVFLIDSDLEEAPELLGEVQRRLEVKRADVVFGIHLRVRRDRRVPM